MKDLEHLSEWMDSKFKIGPFRFGLDGLIGLIPGVGDVITSLVSFYIVLRAVTLGASFALVLRMLLNIFIEYLVGLIPFVGNLFDFVWKSNLKNMELLKTHLKNPVQTKRKAGLILMMVFVFTALFFLSLVYLAFKLVALSFAFLFNLL